MAHPMGKKQHLPTIPSTMDEPRVEGSFEARDASSTSSLSSSLVTPLLLVPTLRSKKTSLDAPLGPPPRPLRTAKPAASSCVYQSPEEGEGDGSPLTDAPPFGLWGSNSSSSSGASRRPRIPLREMVAGSRGELTPSEGRNPTATARRLASRFGGFSELPSVSSSPSPSESTRTFRPWARSAAIRLEFLRRREGDDVMMRRLTGRKQGKAVLVEPCLACEQRPLPPPECPRPLEGYAHPWAWQGPRRYGLLHRRRPPRGGQGPPRGSCDEQKLQWMDRRKRIHPYRESVSSSLR